MLAKGRMTEKELYYETPDFDVESGHRETDVVDYPPINP